MKRFKNIIDLLEASMKPGPSESIRKIAAAFSPDREQGWWAPGDDFVLAALVEEIGDDAATDLDESGWMVPIPDEDNTFILQIPDEVLRRCKAHPDWSKNEHLETVCEDLYDDVYDPNQFLAWHCVLYVWCWERGLL